MVEIVTAPDIVNPFGTRNTFHLDTTSSEDLSLELLLDAVSLNEYGHEVAKSVFRELREDLETVVYRQEVFEELLLDTDLRQTVSTYAQKLYHFRDSLLQVRDIHSSEFMNRLRLLREYITFVNHLPNLDSAKSRVLQEVNTYFKSIKDSGGFQETCKLVPEIENLSGVTFRVAFDNNGKPTSMSAFELVSSDSSEIDIDLSELVEEPAERGYISSLLRKVVNRKKEDPDFKQEQQRTEEQALIERSGELNRLGRDIHLFIERQFTSLLREYSKQVYAMTALVGPLYFYSCFTDYFAKLKEREFDITKPILLAKEERRTDVKNVRNPLVGERRKAMQVTPNDITSNADENMFVITGPNNGGKTTYIKTVGLLQIMAQSGLFVPAEVAELSFVDGIYTHFVAPDDITQGDGRYRNELYRMKSILQRATPFSLVILDEPCGGTSYGEGQKQSLALLDGFHQLGSTTYFTTHMHPLTDEVENGRLPAARNLQVDCIDDGVKLVYTFKIKPGASGKSYGEEIAREVGLMPHNIDAIISEGAAEGGYARLLRK